MAQSSTTLLPATSHKTGVTATDISFTATSGVYTISSTSTILTGSGKFAVGDLVTRTGVATYTVKEVLTSTSFTVEEVLSTLPADGSTSVVLDHTGFVSTKAKGDGYYSQADGVHTVSYHVDATLTGAIKMQGSLAKTPTEDDWFDIAGTTFTTDQSTTIYSANFTGNFVWVRVKATDVTAGSVSKILYNH